MYVDSASVGRRKITLPGEISSAINWQRREVSRGRSSWTKRAVIDRRMVSHQRRTERKIVSNSVRNVPQKCGSSPILNEKQNYKVVADD